MAVELRLMQPQQVADMAYQTDTTYGGRHREIEPKRLRIVKMCELQACLLKQMGS
jgi:hypothetical protein